MTDYIALVQGLTQPTLALVTLNSEAKLNKKDVETKTIPNPYTNVRKVSTMLVELAPKYEKAVNDQREAEGKEQDFVSGARTWGINLGNGIVENNGKFYISAILKESKETRYLIDGEVVAKADLEKFMPKKKSGNNQGLEEAVRFMSLSVENIESLEIQ